MDSPRLFFATRLFTILLSMAAYCSPAVFAVEPIHVGFLWHMHQPVYRPGENILQTDASGAYSFSVVDVHNQRFGPYNSWPRNAVQSGLSLPHLGAQVSFSGSLIQNLNTLESAGVNGGMWNNWDGPYREAGAWDTALGNPRLDLVNFGFNHPLMPLLDTRDIRMQVRLQKHIHEQTWGANVPFSKGIFPPETAFSTRIIPALVAEGIEWTLFDSIHLERATQGYPHTPASNLYPPNPADQINPAIPAEQWVQLNNLWAPSRVAAPFAYQPHHVQHVDPETGQVSKIVAVPAARYEGNEDGRGGFGALQYEQVMSQYRQFNTDPDHPMFVVLHHDGDNFGGGSEAYYHGNFQNMVSWAQGTPDYDVTTVQDYLDRFPPDLNRVVHIENGSWAGADNGDPEFKKWLGDPDPNTGWSPDRNSWAVLTAAKNRVFTADDIAPANNLTNILNGTGTSTEKAWRHLLAAQSSDYWYWDGTEVWDSNVTRGSNLAVAEADLVLNAFVGTETTGPSVFVPQRESYNPGGFEWDPTPEPSDFEVWTYAYDVSGLADVTLKYRVDADGTNPLSSTQNETYAGGAEVGSWVSVPMASSDVAPPPGILAPTYRAPRFGGMITGLEDVLVDYYVEATDALGNVTKTDIQHVYVGNATGGGGPGGGATVMLDPDPALAGGMTTLSYDAAGGPLTAASQVYVHYGFDDWAQVEPDLALNWNADDELWDITLDIPTDVGQLDVVFNDGAGAWDNNGGADWHFTVDGGEPGVEFVMDGVLDPSAIEVATIGGVSLYAVLEGDRLYLATDDAGAGADVFLYLAEQPGALVAANWGKSGQVAGWDAFLADENNNDYEDWFDAEGFAEAATGADGGVLEGVIDLADEFGVVPEELYLAIAHFETEDGGSLLPLLQLPTGNGDGNVDAAEFFLLSLGASYEADFDNDGDVDADDMQAWRDALGQDAGGDADGDLDTDLADLLILQAQYGSGPQSISASLLAVPEPASLALLLTALVAAARRSSRPA